MVFLSVPDTPNRIYPQSFPLSSYSRILPMKVLRFPPSLRKKKDFCEKYTYDINVVRERDVGGKFGAKVH